MIQLGKVGKVQATADQLGEALNKKYHEDFDKIAEEFKCMQSYINAVETKVDVRLELIEKRLDKLEKGKEEADKLQDAEPSKPD